MKKTIFINIFLLVLFNNSIFLNGYSQINNTIIVKVGEKVVTSVDLRNEIFTNLLLNRQEFTQANIDNNKNIALKDLINTAIKKNEIEKYGIDNFNKQDLQNYINSAAQSYNTDSDGLKEIFKQANIDFKAFEERHRIELLWNTLIFQLYRNQMNVNIVDVDNEVEKIKINQTDEELKKARQRILNKRKTEKLKLFSRSHFSNLENTISINFNE